MNNWDVAIEILKPLLPFVDIFDAYDVDFNQFNILFETRHNIIDRKLYCRLKIDGNYIRKYSTKDIVATVLSTYENFDRECNSIIKRYAKHKAGVSRKS